MTDPPAGGTVEVDWVRHGQNVANVTRTMSHRVFDGDLTERGIREAHLLAERLHAEGRRYATVACSPLLRARHTAEILTRRLEIPVTDVLEDLREVDIGELDGRSDPRVWEVYTGVLDAWHRGDLSARFPCGEDGAELVARVRRALTAVTRRVGHGGALVVAHGANLRAAVPALTGAADPGADLPTGALARLDVTPGADGALTAYVLRGWDC